MEETRSDSTYPVIGQALAVHKFCGPGLDELVYQDELSARFDQAGIPHRLRSRKPLMHRGRVADVFEPDFLVEPDLLLEAKVLHGEFTPAHFLQLICYLKLHQCELGLLINFGREQLVVRRVRYTPVPTPLIPCKLANEASRSGDLAYLQSLVDESLARIVGQYGLGYRTSTYQGLLRADLEAEGISVEINTRAEVPGLLAGTRTTKLECLVVGRSLCVSILTLNENITRADVLRLQAAMRCLSIRHGAVINFGKRDLHIQPVSLL